MPQLNPFQGDTIYYQVTITGASEITGTGQLSYTKGRTTLTKSGTLTAGVFTTSFSSVETQAMLGRYEIQLKIQDTSNNDLGTVLDTTLVIEYSDMPTYGA